MANEKAVIQKTKDEAQYDEYAKMLLARKAFLAHILVFTVREFKGMNPKHVETLIEGEPLVGVVPVDEGFSNEKDESGKTVIAGKNSESKIPNEGVVYYDIIFEVNAPSGKKKIIVNIEAQKSLPTKYHVENRGIFYGARNISAQMDRVFSNQEYDKLQKVYSIWICMNCNENTASIIRFHKEDMIGHTTWNSDFELINVIIVELAKDLEDNIENRLHRLLGTLFLPLDVEEKNDILETEFGIDMEKEGKELVDIMCNLSLGIRENGIEEGKIVGRTEGREELILNALKKGRSAEEIVDFMDAPLELVKKVEEKYLQPV